MKKVTGGLGAQAVIVCTASNRAYAQALDFLRFGGTLVCVGMPEGESQPIAKSKMHFSSNLSAFHMHDRLLTECLFPLSFADPAESKY